MKAAVLYDSCQIKIENIPEPVVKPGHLKLKVVWCGICGSDVGEYKNGTMAVDSNGNPRPIVMGHEFSGTVVEVGDGVDGWKVGDRAVAQTHMVCYHCEYCLRGEYTYCKEHRLLGVNGANGAFAEYVCPDAYFCHHLPDTLCDEHAALVEPIAVGFHALTPSGFRPGMNAAVLGAGPIGLGTIAALRASGANKIFAVVRKSIRQEYALKAGADALIDPTDGNAADRIKELTNGIGVDVSYETFGVDLGIDIGLACLRRGGTCTVLSLRSDRASYIAFPLVSDELHLVGSNMYSHSDFETVIRMLNDGIIDPNLFITKRIALDDLDAEGFGTLLGPEKKSHVKIIVTPNSSLI